MRETLGSFESDLRALIEKDIEETEAHKARLEDLLRRRSRPAPPSTPRSRPILPTIDDLGPFESAPFAPASVRPSIPRAEDSLAGVAAVSFTSPPPPPARSSVPMAIALATALVASVAAVASGIEGAEPRPVAASARSGTEPATCFEPPRRRAPAPPRWRRRRSSSHRLRRSRLRPARRAATRAPPR